MHESLSLRFHTCNAFMDKWAFTKTDSSPESGEAAEMYFGLTGNIFYGHDDDFPKWSEGKLGILFYFYFTVIIMLLRE